MQKNIREITPSLFTAPCRKRVAAYARVSTGKETMLHSLVSQIDYYSEHIQQNLEWEFVGVYVDEAVTGTKDSRSGFKRLLADCHKGLIDMVITKSISRFARNTVIMLETIRELKSIGVDVYFEEQDIHSTNSDGELMLTILASFAQEESLSCSENCKWRIRNNFKDGIPNTLRVYGYDFIGKELVINATEAEIVKMIYSDYLSGMGKNAIMKKLMSMCAPTKNGGNWSESIIYGILRNEKYIGSMLLQKKYSNNHLTKQSCKNNGELPMYYVKNTHEPIIPKEVFDKVQEELANRRKQFTKENSSDSKSEFTGIIHCGQCEANFRKKVNNAGTKYASRIWSCATYNSKGKAYCASKQIPENIIRELAADVLGLDEYVTSIFEEKISEIKVPENGTLIFVFKDGSKCTRTWENKSRSESWTEEMRQHARKIYLERRQV